MENLKKQIIDFFNGPQDFNKGLQLLNLVSKKSKIVSKVARRGDTKWAREWMNYELNKVAGLKKIPVPVKSAPTPANKKAQPKPDQKKKTAQDTEDRKKSKYNLIGNTDINEYPKLVQKLVRENSNLYMLRGRKHAAMKRLPEDNSAETISKRVKLVDEIKDISARLEVLFEAWDKYEKFKTEPDEEALWPKKKDNSGSGDQNLNPEELKTLKKNIQSSITKDRNLLLYSSKAKPKNGKENVMPAGPKRTKIERRIAKKEAEITELDQKIADLS